jgi:MFS family permease
MPRGPKSINPKWIYSNFPVAIASGPIGTLVQLYLIQLNGITLGTIYGSLAASIFNGVAIPAALFWGYVIDRLQTRRDLISVSYGVLGLILLSFYLESSTAGTIARYSAFSFISVASATPLNLLIMETEEKRRWALTFAKLSLVSSVGNVLGLMVSTLWSEALPTSLGLLFILLGVFALVSSGLAALMIVDPSISFERETVALRKPSLFSRLLANPVFFLTVPKFSDFRRIFRGLRSSLTRNVPILYLSLILFYLSSGLFNTSFVPALRLASLSAQDVFSVILAGTIVQTLTFRLVGDYIARKTLETTSIQGLALRGLSYIGMGVAVVLFGGPFLLYPALVFYPLAAGVAYGIYYTSSNTMIFNAVQGKSAGSALGVYSAMVGLATALGSLVSGFISIYLSFYVTFFISGILLFAAIAFLSRLRTDLSEQGGIHR